jgi:hypothetical protein
VKTWLVVKDLSRLRFASDFGDTFSRVKGWVLLSSFTISDKDKH